MLLSELEGMRLKLALHTSARQISVESLRFIRVEMVCRVLDHRRVLGNSAVRAWQIVCRLRTTGELTSRVSALDLRLQFALRLRFL